MTNTERNVEIPQVTVKEMTKRDYFAAVALHAILIDKDGPAYLLAKEAYGIADAMMEKSNG